jgi:hypothetical protein
LFPSDNRWVDASIYSGSSIDGPWRQTGSSQLYYDVSFEGEQLTSEARRFRRVEARYWKVLCHPKIPTGGVQLRLEYPQERLRFAANGEPPYQLVGGTLSDDAGPDATFAAVMGALDPDTVKVAIARLSTRAQLGGPAALEIPTEVPWRTIYFWLALLAAVLIVGFMAVRLARDMLTQNN